MDQNDALLNHLLPEDRKQLLEVSKIILDFFSLRGAIAWHQIDAVIRQLMSSLELSRIIRRLPLPLNYHRISLLSLNQPIDLVLFIFISPKKNGEVVLINTYDDHNPNDKIYPMEMLENPISLESGTTIVQTPIHTHKAICHSYIAWIKDNSRVYEQFYKIQEKGTLRLIKNEERTLHDCGLDNSRGQLIHSISVEFF